MSNNPDTGNAEEDKRTSDLLALLYPDEGAEVDVSAYEGDDELAGLRNLRAMLADVSDEEPSDAVSNKLLALAAQHAPAAKTESRGLFAWLGDLLMPLVAHPGLAAAATLILLAGVAGTLYVKGDATVVEPMAPSRGAPPASSSPAPSLEFATEPTPDSTADEPASRSAAAAELLEAPAEDAPADFGQVSDEKSPGGDGYKGGKAKTRSRERGGEGELLGGVAGGVEGGVVGGGRAESSSLSDDGLNKNAKQRAPREPAAETKSESNVLRVKDIDTRDFQGPNSPGAGATGSTATSAPPPPVQSAPSKKATSKPAPSKPVSDKSDDDAEVQQDRKEAARAASLHQEARLAAKKNDCSRVLALGQEIRKLDSAYYDRSFLSDESLKACRQSATKKTKSAD